MSSNKQLRSRTGCLTCRHRHLKCDEGRPVCWRCTIGGRECIPPHEISQPTRSQSPAAKRHVVHTRFARDRAGGEVNPPPPPAAVPATASTSTGHDRNEASLSPVDADSDTSGGHGELPTSIISTPPSPRNISIASLMTTPPGQPRDASSIRMVTTAKRVLPHSTPATTEVGCVNGAFDVQTLQDIIVLRPDHADQRLRTPLGQLSADSTFKLMEEEEELVQHYARYLGRWFQQSDADRHFSIMVPHLARTSKSPILLNAICSFAARHKSLVSPSHDSYPSTIGDKFHEQCIGLLIPALSDPGVAADDSVLAALVLLRLYETITASESGTDSERHLSGISAIVESALRNPWSARRSRLQRAAFWGYFRQCIYAACVYRHPLQFDVSISQIDMRLATPYAGMMATVEEETDWCHWITWILAEVVDFCFGVKRHSFSSGSTSDDGREMGMATWKALLQKVEMWEWNKPKSFLPVARRERDTQKGRWFPEVSFASDWQAYATTQCLAAHILLSVYEPSMRKIWIGDFGFLKAREQLEQKVLSHARLLCGICVANPSNVAVIYTVCHTVFAFAPFLSESEEKRLVLGMLRKGEQEQGWPTAWIIKALEDDWDGVET